MSNKKGFVFIETIITITVLAASLLYIYANFNDVLIKEKTRIHYDDVAYIYRTYYVKEFFLKYNLKNVIGYLSSDNPMIIIGCDYERMFSTTTEDGDNNLSDSINIEALNLCRDMTNVLEISRISIALGDLSYVRNCDNENSNKCNYLKNFIGEEITYLKTLGDLSDKNEYVMIIEYTHLKEDATNKYERNYAWIQI